MECQSESLLTGRLIVTDLVDFLEARLSFLISEKPTHVPLRFAVVQFPNLLLIRS
jgi:hypothetical protein